MTHRTRVTAPRKQKRTDKKAAGGGGGKVFKKIALAAPRNAFRALVSLNVRGLATRLDLAIQKDLNKVKEFWNKFGGKFDGGDSLMQSINTGKNKKPLFGSKINGYDNEYIGALAPATIALIGTASAVLIPVVKLLGDLKIKKSEGEEVITPDEEAEADADGNKITTPNFVPTDAETGSGAGLTTGFKASPLLIGGVLGAGVLIYLLTKKKK